MPAAWHLVDVAPRENTGVPTVAVTVTVWVVVIGPLQPVALAVMTDVPLQPDTYVTAPVLPAIELPPERLAASNE